MRGSRCQAVSSSSVSGGSTHARFSASSSLQMGLGLGLGLGLG